MEMKAVHAGLGRHTMSLSVDQFIAAIKYSMLAIITAGIAVMFAKISVCLFIIYVVQDTHKKFRWCIWGLLAVTFLTTLASCILWGEQAHPIEKLWDHRISGSRSSPEAFTTAVYVGLSK
jgi:hypothetical protein